MRLLECDSRKLLEARGISLPQGETISKVEEMAEAIEEVGLPAMVKAQIPLGGRGKAGGIRKVDSLPQARRTAEEMLGSTLRGEKVEKLLLVEAMEVKEEFYLSLLLDREKGKPLLMASSAGGIMVEQTARERPDAIHKITLDPLLGIQEFQLRELSFELELKGEMAKEFRALAEKVYQVFERYEAQLVEINPLAQVEGGHLSALDAKIVLDDESRAKEEVLEIVNKDWSPPGETELEAKARKLGLQYVELDGNIGIVGNGAGLVMATLDTLSVKGGAPANFLDVGGGADAETIEEALRLVASKSGVEKIFVNIFGGITRCDLVAQGLRHAVKERGIPTVVRLTGTNASQGNKILDKAGIERAKSLEDGARKVVQL